MTAQHQLTRYSPSCQCTQGPSQQGLESTGRWVRSHRLGSAQLTWRVTTPAPQETEQAAQASTCHSRHRCRARRTRSQTDAERRIQCESCHRRTLQEVKCSSGQNVRQRATSGPCSGGSQPVVQTARRHMLLKVKRSRQISSLAHVCSPPVFDRSQSAPPPALSIISERNGYTTSASFWPHSCYRNVPYIYAFMRK